MGWGERLTYPRPSGLIENLAEIWVDPNDDLFVLFGRHLGHDYAGLQVNGDMNIVSDGDSAIGLGCGFVRGVVGHGESWRDTGLADCGRSWSAV